MKCMFFKFFLNFKPYSYLTDFLGCSEIVGKISLHLSQLRKLNLPGKYLVAFFLVVAFSLFPLVDHHCFCSLLLHSFFSLLPLLVYKSNLDLHFTVCFAFSAQSKNKYLKFICFNSMFICFNKFLAV